MFPAPSGGQGMLRNRMTAGGSRSNARHARSCAPQSRASSSLPKKLACAAEERVSYERRRRVVRPAGPCPSVPPVPRRTPTHRQHLPAHGLRGGLRPPGGGGGPAGGGPVPLLRLVEPGLEPRHLLAEGVLRLAPPAGVGEDGLLLGVLEPQHPPPGRQQGPVPVDPLELLGRALARAAAAAARAAGLVLRVAPAPRPPPPGPRRRGPLGRPGRPVHRRSGAHGRRRLGRRPPTLVARGHGGWRRTLLLSPTHVGMSRCCGERR